MNEQFSRTALVLGEEAVVTLQNSRVAVFGLGGVGGYAVEALARSGVGALDLIDHDRVSLTNLNRQIIATHRTVGEYKAEAAARRVADIAPDCVVRTHIAFYLPDTAPQFDLSVYDYIIDAVDTVTAKLALIENAVAVGTPIISCMGTGNKRDPATLRVSDIEKTSTCPLARVMRKELKARGIRHVKVVWSPEAPQSVGVCREQPTGSRRSVPGSTAFVPGAAGLLLASEVVKDLIALKKP